MTTEETTVVETTETSNEEVTTEETTDTSATQEGTISEVMDMMMNGVPEDTSQEETTENKSQEETQIEMNDESDVDFENFTFTVDGQEEKLNLKSKEGIEKAREYLQKGRYSEKGMKEAKDMKTEAERMQQLVNQNLDAMGYAYLQSVQKGEIVVQKPRWEDFDRDTEKYSSTEEAETAYRKATENYEKTTEALINYGRKTADNYAKYKEMLNNFTTENKIADVDEWTKKNIDPIYKSLTSFGAEPIPKELFEAMYFYTNKDAVIKEAIEKDRKERLKDPGKKIETPSKKVETKAQNPNPFGEDVSNVKVKFR